MKTIQKIEIFTGLATNLVLFLYLCLLIWAFGLNSEVTGNIQDGIVWFAIPWLFSFLVAVGAVIHAKTQSKIALIILCVGAGFVSLELGFIAFIIFIWGGFSLLGLLFFLLVVTPIILSIRTTILAFSSEKIAD